ncbi:hypothetical protein EV421DRAFT_1740142 [Armillaria borealis]|uniref:Uncharacterized protein n=1 Tax=Armillaria borealis TaxID=47425 RepID=A0AA39MIX0_9AGAR|nr:hypothetical protein EV421DRAFT_1740142 [Armillaria borealis]
MLLLLHDIIGIDKRLVFTSFQAHPPILRTNLLHSSVNSPSRFSRFGGGPCTDTGNHWDGTLYNNDEYQTMNIRHGQDTGCVEYGLSGIKSSGRLKEDADRGVTHANLPRADADPERRPVLIKGRLGGNNEVKCGRLKVHDMAVVSGEEIIEHRSWLSADMRSSGSDVTARNRPWENGRSGVNLKHAQNLDPPSRHTPPMYNRRIWFSDCGVTRERADRPNADSLGLVSKIYFQIKMTVWKGVRPASSFSSWQLRSRCFWKTRQRVNLIL